MAQYLEAAMLTAFSISWYCSIWKMLQTRQACGKSLSFVVLICCGYVSGIGSKLTLYRETGIWSDLIFLYAWNLAMTAFDAYLVLHFSWRARRRSPNLSPVRSKLLPSAASAARHATS